MKTTKIKPVIYKEIGLKVLDWINKRDIYQKELAIPLGINKTNITRLVKGNKVIAIHESIILCKVLDVEMLVTKSGVEIFDAKNKKVKKK